MPDYKEMYLTLMRETEKAIRTLTEAQRTCEELYVRDDGPSLRLFPGGDIPQDGPKHDERPAKPWV